MSRISALVLLGILIIGSLMLTGRLLTTNPAAAEREPGALNTVRILCFENSTNNLQSDHEYDTTDGKVDVSQLPGLCDQYIALETVHEQPSGHEGHGIAFTVYETSYTDADHPATKPLTSPTIEANSGNYLTLFHVVASLAWQPNSASKVLTELQVHEALRHASDYLFDVTDGQMAFGDIQVYTGGEQWMAADLRFLPANNQRPAAFVGGISPEPYVVPGGLSGTTYAPASIYFGRSWDGARGIQDEIAGNWTNTPTGTHTIIHEWSHYALFLYDEYQNVDGSKGYCIRNDLPSTTGSLVESRGSIMAYHYTTSEFWHPHAHAADVSGTANNCTNNWNYHFHGTSDWQVLDSWEAFMGGLPIDAMVHDTSSLQPVPVMGPIPVVTDRPPGFGAFLPLITEGNGHTPSGPAEPEIQITETDLAHRPDKISSEIYTLIGDPEKPSRILFQGALYPTSDTGDYKGTIRLLSDVKDGFIRAYLENKENGRRFMFPGSGGFEDVPTDGRVYETTEEEVGYDLTHRFKVNQGIPIEVGFAYAPETELSQEPMATLCSMEIDGCYQWEVKKMTRDGARWLVSFTAEEIGREALPRFLIIRIVAPELGIQNDVIQWVKMSGGVGPGHFDGGAPLVDDVVMINADKLFGPDDENDCNITSFAPARDARALQAQLPNGIEGFLTQPYLVRIQLPVDGREQCPMLDPAETFAFQSLFAVLNMGYEQADISRVGVSESGNDLLILHYDESRAEWRELDGIDVNSELNFVTTYMFEDGIYVIAYRTLNQGGNQPPSITVTNPDQDTGTDNFDFIYDGFDDTVNLWYKDVTLEASASDPEDGVLSASAITWVTDRTDLQAARLGTGSSLTVRLYSDNAFGEWHKITATATDSGGLNSSAVRNIFIWTIAR